MTTKALVPASLGLALAILVVVFVVVFRRRWRYQKVATDSNQPDAAKTTIEGFKLFRRKSRLRNDIPEFVIPGTQLRLVQPVITPPSPTKATTPPSHDASPDAEDVGHTMKFENEDNASIPRRRTSAPHSIDSKRKISLQLTNRQIAGDKPGRSAALRSTSLDLTPADDSATTPPTTSEFRQVHAVSPLAWEPPERKRSFSRTSSVSSMDMLSINVPPAPLSRSSSYDGSENSSRQSPGDSPRLMRLFRQSKHQIKLTGATVEFSLQYQISKRALILNVMRVKNVFIPVDRKNDAKISLSIHLKPDKFIWEAQTKFVQGTENPIFGEMFTICGFSLSRLHDCALLFRLKDFNVDQTIGEVTFSLGDLQPDVLTSRSCQLQRPINVAKDKDRSYVGDLLVSMDYDPINWKLNVRIIRARGLPKMSRGGHTDAFVKVNVMQELTRIYKRKTRVQHHEWNPEFDEGFEFELTRDQMESTSITMKVIHRGKIRDHLIGVVLLGTNVDPVETGYQHWAMILDKPNLSIEQWHKIYPVLK